MLKNKKKVEYKMQKKDGERKHDDEYLHAKGIVLNS